MRLLTTVKLTARGLLTRHAATTSKRDTRRSLQLEWLRGISALDAAEVYSEFNTKRDGLSASEVELARASWGTNEVAHIHRDPAFVRFLKAFAIPSREFSPFSPWYPW